MRESALLQRFNRAVPYPVRLLLVLLAGVALYGSGMSAFAMFIKWRGGAPACPWDRTARFGWDHIRFQKQSLTTSARGVKLLREEAGLQLFEAGGRTFWIQRSGSDKNGKELLGYLLTEHEWMLESNTAEHVQPGDVVLDCGAHVGVFTNMALRRGASKVVAIEPDPQNLICFRRNFAAEIKAGRVVVVPKGVWNKEESLKLYTGDINSGTGSMVHDQNVGSITVPVTTVDRIVEELGLKKVDFIKMDIEGAERNALRGASKTMKDHAPSLMLDMYHLPDDPTVLPGIIGQANSRYSITCGPCEESLVPHVSYFIARR